MSNLKTSWWKWLTVATLLYVVGYGLVIEVPRQPILNETVRNLFFHVPMWFGMTILLLISMVNSIRYLRTGNPSFDVSASETAKVGIVFGLLGISTGSVWARFTWGAWWTIDPKLNAAAVALLIYFAYLILRRSFDDPQQKGKVSAVYNIFAFFMFNALIYIMPRLTDSLHPGNGGNPGFNIYDSDNSLKGIFYPAVLGWILLGWWIASLYIRLKKTTEEYLVLEKLFGASK